MILILSLSCSVKQSSVRLIGLITDIKAITFINLGDAKSIYCFLEIDNEFGTSAIISDCAELLNFELYVYPGQYLYFCSTTNSSWVCNLSTPYGNGTFFVAANKDLEQLFTGKEN